MALPHNALGLSAVCDCVISLSYSLTFSESGVTQERLEKSDHFRFWYPTSFDFCIVKLLLVQMFFLLPDELKRKLLQLVSP